MSKKILVVDDDADTRDLLCFNFEHAGFIVNTAVDGDDALIKVRLLEPDLILLDVMMPDVDGFTVCEILRRDPVTANVPIIMLTALNSQLSRLRGMEIGATDYFAKPFDFKKLVARIEDLLHLKPAVA
jgi:DNA-binding response OmpR family regulator